MFKSLLAITCLTLSIGANAAYVVESAPGVATGIGNLEIDGTFYNVDFEAVGNAYSTFGGSENFWGDEASAVIATGAAADVLTSSGIFTLNNGTFTTLGFEGFGAYFPADGAAVERAVAGVWIADVGDWAVSEAYAGTAWSVTTVPLPAAAWLFGSALLGLGAIKRRKS